MKIGEKIRKIREIKGISQDAVATHLDISPQAYGKMERGETKLDHVRIEEIAKYLQMNVEDIINFDAKNIFNNTFNDKVRDSFNFGESKENLMITERFLATLDGIFNNYNKLLESNMKIIERLSELGKI